MSAAVLREAAALMRSRAEAATPGETKRGNDWDAYVLGSEGYAVMGEPREGRKVRTFVARCGMNDWGTDKANAEHIASWHPAVALAVADWLDMESRRYESRLLSARAQASDEKATKACDHLARHALAVARAYLGGA